jgi:hypothetical protein
MRPQIDCMKSLRPKDYTRKTILASLHQDDETRFHENAVRTLKTGTFNDIHLKCQLDKFERYVFSCL